LVDLWGALWRTLLDENAVKERGFAAAAADAAAGANRVMGAMKGWNPAGHPTK
jgi:hypothetical protein